jgi:hypothetical protein
MITVLLNVDVQQPLSSSPLVHVRSTTQKHHRCSEKWIVPNVFARHFLRGLN